MRIKSEMTRGDYINASIAFRYTRISTKIITGIGLLFGLILIYLAIQFPEGVNSSELIVPLILIFMPLVSTYFMARLNYNSNQRLREPMEYIFSDDKLTVQGESYSTQFTWEKLYKVTQTKNWIFIWQNRMSATPIAKKDLSDRDISEIKTLLDFHQVKNKL